MVGVFFGNIDGEKIVTLVIFFNWDLKGSILNGICTGSAREMVVEIVNQKSRNALFFFIVWSVGKE